VGRQRSAPRGLPKKGAANGRWVTYHPNGRRRVSCDLVDGVLHGKVIAWTNAGELVAQGRMDGGHPVGTWSLWSAGVREEVPASGVDLAATFEGTWSSEGSAGARAPARAVAVWLAEAASPPTGIVDMTPDPDVAAPSAADVARTDSVPSVPLRSQPWTVRESDAIDYLVARYSNGAKGVQAPRGSGYGRRRGAAGQEQQGGDPTLSRRFLGTELPWTRFHRADGGVVDLDDFRGKKKICVVVLRGFSREVCIYCVTQTEALCDNIQGFRDAGCEVFVVYPGERNRLDAFMESFKQNTKHEGEPPVGVLYDRDMLLVDRMGIRSEFAYPSTFVVDEQGIIRYSYVGVEIDDRPSSADVLDAIRKLASP
jgi:peroxiredoxin